MVAAVVGLDVGTSAVRAVMLDDTGAFVTREVQRLPAGRRTDDGGHLLDEAAILAAAEETLENVCFRGRVRAAAVAVSATAGTLCFRDENNQAVGEAVAYDDLRHGDGLARVAAWLRELPAARRVIPLADAVLERFGAEPGGTDWTNARALGWDPRTLTWGGDGDEASRIEGALPRPVAPGTPAGRVTTTSLARRALLVRGLTDGCGMQVAAGSLLPGRWSISLGTTIIWKAATLGPAPPERLPAGAYAHRLRLQTWLPGAASNAGGGTLVALERGADLAALDRECTFPAVSVAYPLARPGERFPVADSRFGGFGVPDEDGATRHAVILEGLAMITRLGVEKLMAGGVPDPELIRVTGGGSSSEPWMQVTANVLDRRLVSVPELDPAVGAALLAAASVSERRLEDLTPAPGATGEAREYEPDPELARVYRERYGEFLDKLA